MPVGRIATYPAALAYEAAWNATPLQSFPPPLWTDVSARALGPWSTSRGTDYWLARTTAGTFTPVLDNRDGALDPSNAAGPYYPNATPGRGLRVRMQFGVNQLTADQATGGEQTGQLGVIPPWMSIVNDAGYPLTIVASGSAYQGSRVYQAVLPNGAAAGATILLLKNAPVIPLQPYAWQAQCRITSGNSVSTQCAILWFDANGNSLGTTAGTAQTLTSGSSSWVQLSASTSAAPSGAYSAQLKVQIASGTLSGSTTWQIDGLQWEQSAYPTLWTLPGTLGANLLPQGVATGTASINPATDSAGNYFASAAGTLAQATNLTAAPNGSTAAVAWTSPSGTTNASPLYAGVVGPLAPALDGPVADCVQVTGGVQYAASFYAMRVSSADATIQVTPAIRWFDATGTVISAPAGSAVTVPVGSWVRGSVTATAPAGAVWARPRCAISTPGSTTATNTIYSTGWQLEAAASASTWADPGPQYFAWTGVWDQFPQTWRLSGTWGELDAAGVDALAGLALYTVQQPFVEEALALGPDFFYQLNDPAGSTSVADSAGKRPAAPIENSPFGAGSLTLGSSVTANTAGSAFIGTAGPVATLNNNPSQTNLQTAQTFISLHKTTSVPGPPSIHGGPSAGVTNPAWTRMFAFRASTTPGTQAFPNLWCALAPFFSADQSSCELYLNATTGTLSYQGTDANGAGPLYTSAANMCDGNWHQVAVCYTGGLTGFFDVYLDGTRVFHDNNGGAGWNGPTSIATDVVGSHVVYGNNIYDNGWVGDLAHVAQFPFALSTTQAANLYSSWRTASAGESSGARVKRLLGWVGWPGATSIDTGQTTSMGPATDLAGQAALSGFNAIVNTEGGDGFVAASGAITFKSRAARYNSVPQFIFGEGPPFGNPGEWPYQGTDNDLLIPTDLANTFNIIPTQQYSTGQVALAQDAASQAAIWPRTLPTRTINSTSFAEVQAAGQYLLGQLKSARPRLASMVLDPAAVPGLFRVCAQLEKGTRIRQIKRPPGRSTPIQLDLFVERVEWAVDPRSGGGALLRVEASPADLAAYWTLGALHTTLRSQAGSGQAQATINALPDAAYNRLSSSLPQGYQLTFDPGTAIAETMTLSPTGIPATNIGYSSATLTFTSNFAFTHAAGAVVCEPLPPGYTDPTTWDASSVLGAASCQVVSGGASGTNTITVGPLGDAAVNTLASDWNTGDLLWISPGTPNFEGYNLLTPNQATAGEGVLPLAAGTAGSTVGLSADTGTPTVTASASAWQGANVWQTGCAGGVATPTGLLYVLKAPATALLAFTVSAYVRSITTGANPSVFIYVKFLDATSASLGQTNGSTTGLTGGPSASWTRLTATATAPAGTVWLQLGIVLTGTAPASSWSFQADGLQIEQASSASVFCVTPQVKSVGGTVPGYSSVTVTVNSNFINSHSAGDVVCDPLPPGTTSPTAAATVGTTRIAY